MDSGSVARVSPDENLAAPHGVARRVAHVAVDHDPSGVHGVAHRVLGVAVDLDLGSVQVGSKGISGNPGNRDPFVRHSGSEKPVPQAVDHLAVAVFPKQPIQGGIVHIPGIQYHLYHTRSFISTFFSKGNL